MAAQPSRPEPHGSPDPIDLTQEISPSPPPTTTSLGTGTRPAHYRDSPAAEERPAKRARVDSGAEAGPSSSPGLPQQLLAPPAESAVFLLLRVRGLADRWNRCAALPSHVTWPRMQHLCKRQCIRLPTTVKRMHPVGMARSLCIHEAQYTPGITFCLNV